MIYKNFIVLLVVFTVKCSSELCTLFLIEHIRFFIIIMTYSAIFIKLAGITNRNTKIQ